MTLHEQIKQRRHELGLTQKAMESRIGMPRQQYQRLESNGNPRLDTLQLVAEGLNAELLLIPREKLHAVRRLLQETYHDASVQAPPAADVDPWHDILGSLDDESNDKS